MVDCVAVEVDKAYNDTRIQILISPVAVGCRDSSSVDERADASRTDSERSASNEHAAQLGSGSTGATGGRGHSQAPGSPGNSSGTWSAERERQAFRHLRSAPEAHLADGFAVLMGLQLRMHAMFSREGLAHEAETLEYGWLIEVELGHVLARLNTAHVRTLICFVRQRASQRSDFTCIHVKWSCQLTDSTPTQKEIALDKIEISY